MVSALAQAKCIETGETVAIKKVLQDKRYKNRELQIMRSIDHCNVISLKHCFFSTTSRDELFLNLVMEFVPESLYRVLKHYKDMKQRMPLIYVKLYMYQVGRGRIACYLDMHVLEGLRLPCLLPRVPVRVSDSKSTVSCCSPRNQAHHKLPSLN